MIRQCNWCIPSHVLGVRCDRCGSENCVAAVKRPYWLCVECGAYFENDVITHGMCDGARLAFEGDAPENLTGENGPRMLRTALALALVVAAMAALVLRCWL